MERKRHPGTVVQPARSFPDFASLNPGYKLKSGLQAENGLALPRDRRSSEH